MLGWRDGGRTRWWQWPKRLGAAGWQRLSTAAALEDMDRLRVVTVALPGHGAGGATRPSAEHAS
jgi:hypothetical protein